MARILPDTKFFIPPPRDSLVPRARLTALLDRGLQARLTLISAPPGFGKTSLLAQWLAASDPEDRVTAWLSIDPTDDEPTAFWAALASAIHRALPDAGAALAMLEEAQPPPIDTVLTTLINELAAAGRDIVLVLDDYHAIETAEIHDQVGSLLEYLPSSTHVAITTRADPPVPLARLRAQGQLVEIRAADLRFTRAETGTYLTTAAGLHLDGDQIAALEDRTEGWIAALQLAALSMQGRDDVAVFITGFAGDDRFVVDYLAEEVLERQSDDLRRFLLRTSILDRLNGDLCEAVTGESGGQTTLDVLDRRNLFVIPLDARREWYRYHHLFADVLRARLLREEPDLVHELHRRASRWYEGHGDRSDAIRHALAGEDHERAADMIELAIPGLRQARQEATIRRWIEQLPDRLLGVRPVLSVGYVGALMANGETADVEAVLQSAERWLEPAADAGRGRPRPPGPMVVVDDAEFRRLPSAVALYRAAQAQMEGDRARTEVFALRALDLADDDPLGRGAAAGFLGLTHWGDGDLEAAHGFWTEAMASLQRAGYAVDAVGCHRPLAEIRTARGRLREAMRTYEQGLRMATGDGSTVLRGASDMHVGMSELCLEWNDVDAAAAHLRKSDDLGDRGGLAQNPYRWRVAMAQLRLAERDAEGALGLLKDAERVFVSEYYPVTRPIPALAARIHAAHGRLREAEAWAGERGLSVDDDLDYVGEYEHITLARVLLAQGAWTHDPRPGRQAIALLERLLAAAETGGRWRTVIEILVLQAVANHGRTIGSAALEPLARALELAEPEGYVRTFVSEEASMTAMLAAASRRGITPAYVRHLQAAASTDARGATNRRLAEPLSQRELDVLRLLASDLDGPGIAGELVVGLSTVRTHTKSIYAKLGVNDRRAAVRRGQELSLIPPSGGR